MTATARAPFWTRGRALGTVLACAILGVFAVANIHLITVSLASQPDCVPHLKTPQKGAATYRAAKPSC